MKTALLVLVILNLAFQIFWSVQLYGIRRSLRMKEWWR